jgi:D-hydroxyproline dehydrogenase subunit gamma
MPDQITADQVTVFVNGARVAVPRDATVAVAMMIAGQACRKSVNGEPRGPLCGMGICFECRVVINGTPHCKSCQILCVPGMKVSTNE